MRVKVSIILRFGNIIIPYENIDVCDLIKLALLQF